MSESPSPPSREAEADDIIKLACTAKDCSGAGAIGVTTFISRVLRNGYGAYQHAAQGERFKSSDGLRIGRKCDVEFQRLVKTAGCGPVRIGQCSPRIRGVGKVLIKQGIRVVGTQVPVHLTIGSGETIKTRLDGLGYIPKTHTFVVIELKTTQRSYKSHLATYKTPCLRHPEMVNGLPNCEWTSHMLQTGFGMAAFRRRFPSKANIEGIVIVSAADGKTVGYRVPPEFSSARKLMRPPGCQGIPCGAFDRSSGVLAAFDGRQQSVIGALSPRYGPITAARPSGDYKVWTFTAAKNVRIICAMSGATSASALSECRARLAKASTSASTIKGLLRPISGGLRFQPLVGFSKKSKPPGKFKRRKIGNSGRK